MTPKGLTWIKKRDCVICEKQIPEKRSGRGVT